MDVPFAGGEGVEQVLETNLREGSLCSQGPLWQKHSVGTFYIDCK